MNTGLSALILMLSDLENALKSEFLFGGGFIHIDYTKTVSAGLKIVIFL